MFLDSFEIIMKGGTAEAKPSERLLDEFPVSNHHRNLRPDLPKIKAETAPRTTPRCLWLCSLILLLLTGLAAVLISLILVQRVIEVEKTQKTLLEENAQFSGRFNTQDAEINKLSKTVALLADRLAAMNEKEFKVSWRFGVKSACNIWPFFVDPSHFFIICSNATILHLKY